MVKVHSFILICFIIFSLHSLFDILSNIERRRSIILFHLRYFWFFLTTFINHRGYIVRVPIFIFFLLLLFHYIHTLIFWCLYWLSRRFMEFRGILRLNLAHFLSLRYFIIGKTHWFIRSLIIICARRSNLLLKWTFKRRILGSWGRILYLWIFISIPSTWRYLLNGC